MVDPEYWSTIRDLGYIAPKWFQERPGVAFVINRRRFLEWVNSRGSSVFPSLKAWARGGYQGAIATPNGLVWMVSEDVAS